VDVAQHYRAAGKHVYALTNYKAAVDADRSGVASQECVAIDTDLGHSPGSVEVYSLHRVSSLTSSLPVLL